MTSMVSKIEKLSRLLNNISDNDSVSTLKVLPVSKVDMLNIFIISLLCVYVGHSLKLFISKHDVEYVIVLEYEVQCMKDCNFLYDTYRNKQI
jgi:hypothetical protein